MYVLLFLGIVVSLVLAECSGFSPGGVVVAGYLAMFVFNPGWLAGTFIAALLTYLTVRIFQNRMLLYGRRLFSVYVLTGIFITRSLSWLLTAGYMPEMGLMVIGYLIPGLMARDFQRQGILATSVCLIIAVILTRLLFMAGEGMVW